MSDKDPTIKLFGRKIPLPECQIPAKYGAMDACRSLKKIEVEIPGVESSVQQENSPDLRDSKQESQQIVQENQPKSNLKPVEVNVETSSSDQDKILKKPDKILQCPRCNSLDTKFCYFNNYNVNQPRHFCKNCQRYWTAGGTMRNVPVGAGRRKNKQLGPPYRQIIVTSNGIPTTGLESTHSSSHQLISSLESAAVLRSSRDNGTVLKFGPDAPLCESMESMLNLRDQKRSADANSTISCAENGEEEPSLCASSVTNASTQGNEFSDHATPNYLQCYPVPPWVFPWNAGWNDVASMSAVHQSSMQWCAPPMVTVPGISPPSIPVQFIPASYWNGSPVLPNGTSMVSTGSNGCLSPCSSTSNSCCSGNGSPTLGKHTRDQTTSNDEEKSEKCVFFPKSLRIDDPNDQHSKSPIWAATLGIKPEKRKFVSKGDILKKTEAKEGGKDRVLGVSQVLEANRAAISRVHTFQESIQ